MNKTLRKILLILGIFLGILFIQNYSNAAGLQLKDLEYVVYLNEDGSANVTEKWKIAIEDTNTLFKTFEVDKTKYKEITDVSVKETKKNGTHLDFTDINKEKYHVDKNCYYALINKKGQFEIAWGAHAEDVTKNYEISYKIIDAVKNYNDVSEFYWQFISTSSEIPANSVFGTVYLPGEVINKEDLRAWAHGPLNGDIAVKTDRVIFTVDNLPKRTMLEVRVASPTSLFSTNTNIVDTNKLESIIKQEQQWADEANALREKLQKQKETRQKLIKIALIISNIIGIVLAIILIKKIINYNKILKENPVLKPEAQYPYFRDIPDEKATPAQVAFLYYFKTQTSSNITARNVSATMLDLCMKNYLTFETIPDKKDEIKIILNQSSGEELPKDEQIVYDLLEEALNSKGNKEERSLTMKDFDKYVKANPSSVFKKLEKIKEEAKKIEEEKGNYDGKIIKKSEDWTLKSIAYFLLLIATIVFMQTLTIPTIIAMIWCIRISSRYNRLPQKGVNEREMWSGLKRYMEDFSNMKEKEVPELVLWEKYLIYATVFGIADKVIKQLKVVYPQIADPEYMNSHGYTYMYLMYSGSFRNSFVNSLNTSVNTSYTNSANYSSGSGSGGGFSGGGGFGGGGGRNGRKIEIGKLKITS